MAKNIDGNTIRIEQIVKSNIAIMILGQKNIKAPIYNSNDSIIVILDFLNGRYSLPTF